MEWDSEGSAGIVESAVIERGMMYFATQVSIFWAKRITHGLSASYKGSAGCVWGIKGGRHPDNPSL